MPWLLCPLLLLSRIPPPAAEFTPASPPLSPVDRAFSLGRHLLFDVAEHEQVNKQRRALMFYLDLAMQLDRVLVLPRVRLLRRSASSPVSFESAAEYVPWADLFNISRLGRAHAVVGLDEYVAQHGGVSLLLRRCQTGGPAAEYQPAVLRKEHAATPSIAFAESVDQLGAQRVAPLRPYVRFVDRTYDEAAAFVRGAFAGKPFLALHWRRTDFHAVRRSHEWALQSAADLIKHARHAMRRHGLAGVYLATDSDDPAEMAEVQRALRFARVRQKGGGSLRDRVETANLEIAICASATRFLGTRTSSFTLTILEERRAVFGQSEESGGEMGRPPEEEEAVVEGGKEEL
ncbi:hypothetical protein EMIHUDRAFT_224916 [Emiliania huxleyi CCMP1516]|uniref:GDP-fucose protein O-fucosyltransferase 2 n=2 Tax=Emiliania huxleyi TaxID=2903 RepID=A0A0D3KQ93_EMIH1|nr:hypothetical protein EMIHUDRAFT_224916 [Emiliania huxleyi CCMP1516]EOD37928.1 hypothetical protein EMIHUDRAFT_224916 [Emiliania huxleyi CCMP1516]|eukprot:XP_005790357.1 hypothetical protein EMIHUDRAFT_224916 [Emiliania huxleyi CCMP1516]